MREFDYRVKLADRDRGARIDGRLIQKAAGIAIVAEQFFDFSPQLSVVATGLIQIRGTLRDVGQVGSAVEDLLFVNLL